MDDYTTLGYDKSLNKSQPTQRYTDVDFEQLVDSISANKISQGISESDKIKIDYDSGVVKIKEGTSTRVEIGKFLDGTYGVRVYDANGNVVIDNAT